MKPAHAQPLAAGITAARPTAGLTARPTACVTGIRRAAAVTLVSLCLAFHLGCDVRAQPNEAAPAAADPALEARVLRLSAELRCLVCQNQTIADSNADLAVDLRRQVREMLVKGQSDRDVIDYMTARYGDFVLYRPPVKGTTALLWYGPAALLALAVAALLLILRRRSKLPAERFEADPEG